MKKIFITGTAGFIGYHLAKLLLREGYEVFGYDAFTDYYDVKLKRKRNQDLLQNNGFTSFEGRIENEEILSSKIVDFQPDVIVHLAAQAGVRYSLENPRAYLETNVVGTFNILECASKIQCQHLLMASTSSIYGANTEMPFKENQRTDHPLTVYAATKKSNEDFAHAYSYLHQIPTTMFRFFTVYGPWGRPDLALFKFVNAMLDGEKIDIYNNGKMYRDFTYVDDLVKSIYLLMLRKPSHANDANETTPLNASPVAPYRVVNIGNSQKVNLMEFIVAIEKKLGIKAQKNFMEMQLGDVPATWADCTRLTEITNFSPTTDIETGISEFIDWFRHYYQK